MSQAPVGSEGAGEAEVTLKFRYKTVLAMVFGLTVLSAVLAIALAVVVATVHLNERAHETLNGLLQVCLTTWQMGFGGLIGLLGGKAL